MAWLGEFLGTLLASGIVSAGALFALFKIFGEKWLDAKFEQRLAKYKHEHDQEIERLRGRINALMDRTIKLHQHEFETLPQGSIKRRVRVNPVSGGVLPIIP
jgi:hypothetical protein